MSATISQYVQVLAVLPEEDRDAILNVGVAFRRIEIEKRLARAQSIIRDFEVKYETTFERFAVDGLPDDADYQLHEDYIEWHHWVRVAVKARQTLDAVNTLFENRVG